MQYVHLTAASSCDYCKAVHLRRSFCTDSAALSDKPNNLPWVSSMGPTSHSSHVLSKKLVWSYKSPILPKRATDAATGIQAHSKSPASDYSLPVPTLATFSPLSLLSASVVDTLREAKKTNSPGRMINILPPVPSASPNLTLASILQLPPLCLLSMRAQHFISTILVLLHHSRYLRP